MNPMLPQCYQSHLIHINQNDLQVVYLVHLKTGEWITCFLL